MHLYSAKSCTTHRSNTLQIKAIVYRQSKLIILRACLQMVWCLLVRCLDFVNSLKVDALCRDKGIKKPLCL